MWKSREVLKVTHTAERAGGTAEQAGGTAEQAGGTAGQVGGTAGRNASRTTGGA